MFYWNFGFGIKSILNEKIKVRSEFFILNVHLILVADS